MARWKIELHLPFLVIGVEDMQIKFSRHRRRNLSESPNSLPPPPGSTGRFLALRDGSVVGYRETIEGAAVDLAPGLSSPKPRCRDAEPLAAAAHDRIGGIMTVWPIGSRGSGQPVTSMQEA